MVTQADARLEFSARAPVCAAWRPARTFTLYDATLGLSRVKDYRLTPVASFGGM
jgi:hypothetical protein